MHIKFITCFFTTMILCSWHAPTTAGSEEISVIYSKESSTPQDNGTVKEIITYAVSSQISSITKENETVFIDYDHLRLYRHHKSENSCESFTLNNPSPVIKETSSDKKTALHSMKNLVGSTKVITTDEHRKIEGYNCQKKHILFASDLSFSQMVTPPVIKQFGQDFTESMATYWVTRDIDGLDALLKIARKHKEIYQANPLLRQIDMVGLFEMLEGFPVMIEKKTRQDIEKYTLISLKRTSNTNESFILPEICRKIIRDNK
jgi:hypothetical protein